MDFQRNCLPMENELPNEYLNLQLFSTLKQNLTKGSELPVKENTLGWIIWDQGQVRFCSEWIDLYVVGLGPSTAGRKWDKWIETAFSGVNPNLILTSNNLYLYGLTMREIKYITSDMFQHTIRMFNSHVTPRKVPNLAFLNIKFCETRKIQYIHMIWLTFQWL